MPKFIAFFVRINKFFRYDIWQITEYELSRSRRYTYRVIKTLILAVRGFITDDLSVKASALTYSILFAIVPFLSLIIVVTKGLGFDQIIEQSLEDTLIGQVKLIPTIMGFVDRYLKTAQGGMFFGVGFIILVLSVMSFFRQVENSFNCIWKVKKGRSLIRQFTTYFSSVLIIPVLVIFSSGLSLFITSTVSHTYLYDVLTPFWRFGVKFTPYLVDWIVFTIIYFVIPNTRVRFQNALISGLIAGTAFQLFQFLYIHGQNYLSRYNIVYGSFAAIPLLFLWLQISCLIVLLGAEISYASQNLQNFDYETDSKNISTRYKNFLTLFITYVIIKQFENKKPALSSDQLSMNYNLPIRIVNQILSRLVNSSILNEVFDRHSKTRTYQPAIDINQLSVNLLFRKLDSHGSEMFLTNKNELLDLFWEKTIEIRGKSDDYLDQILIKDL